MAKIEMIPQLPVPPVTGKRKKKEVLYFDGPISEIKNLKENPEYHLFFQVPWSDRMGYDIARYPEGAEFYLIANKNILQGREKIDADKVFGKYDMIYFPDFGKNRAFV